MARAAGADARRRARMASAGGTSRPRSGVRTRLSPGASQAVGRVCRTSSGRRSPISPGRSGLRLWSASPAPASPPCCLRRGRPGRRRAIGFMGRPCPARRPRASRNSSGIAEPHARVMGHGLAESTGGFSGRATFWWWTRRAWWEAGSSPGSSARPSCAGAKIVVVGDHEQLQAIGAGAPFRAIAEQVGHAKLSGIAASGSTGSGRPPPPSRAIGRGRTIRLSGSWGRAMEADGAGARGPTCGTSRRSRRRADGTRSRRRTAALTFGPSTTPFAPRFASGRAGPRRGGRRILFGTRMAGACRAGRRIVFLENDRELE